MKICPAYQYFKNTGHIFMYLIKNERWFIEIGNRKDMNGNYIKYPRDIIEMKGLDTRRMAVFTYLAQHRALDDTVQITLNYLTRKSGYIPDSHVGKINSQINIILDTLESIGYFVLLEGNYSGDKFCVLRLNTENFDIGKGYSCISLKELDLLFSHKSNKNNTSFSNLILTLAHIRVNKLRRSDNQQGDPKKKPEFFYRQIKSIASDIGLSERTVSKCIQALNDLDIIVSRPMQRYKDKYDHWHTDVTLFVDKFEGWEDELRWGEEFLLKNKLLYEDDRQS